MTTRAKRLATIACIVALVLLAADYVVWRITTDRLASAYLRWQAALAASGWQAESDSAVATGWPFAARIRLDHTRLGEPAANGFAWSGDSVTFGIDLRHPRQLTIIPSGEQTLDGPGWTPVHLHADRLVAVAPLETPITTLHVTASGFAVASTNGDAVAQSVQLDVAWNTDAATLNLHAGPIAMPPEHHYGLGQTLRTAAISLTGHGAWPAVPAAQAAQQWRTAGGFVDVSGLSLQWGTLDLTGTGQAKLDNTLQPDATIALRVVDPAAAVSMLADEGAISHGAATAIEAVLTLLAMPARLAGQPAVLNLPLRIQAGTVSLGQIPVLKLPAIAWNPTHGSLPDQQ